MRRPVPAAKRSTRDAHLPEGHRDPRDHQPPGEGLSPQCPSVNPIGSEDGEDVKLLLKETGPEHSLWLNPG